MNFVSVHFWAACKKDSGGLPCIPGHFKKRRKGGMPPGTPMSRPVKVNNFSKNLNVLMDERSEAAWPPPFLMSRSSYST